MNRTGMKVSVIVPAYNVENYLRKCMESLLNQTYRNIEILLIDDGSTDNTGAIADEYCIYDVVHVYHKKNGGLSDARNYGLDKITGDYVTFVDSDDYVYEKYIEYMLDLVQGEKNQIVVIPSQNYNDADEVSLDFDIRTEFVSTEHAVKKMLLRNGITHTACGKLYKADLWKNIRFPYAELYEDYHTIFDVFNKAENVAIGYSKMYFYYQRADSIMHLKCDERTNSIVEATRKVTPRIISYWPEAETEAKDLQAALCLKCLQRIYRNGINTFLDVQRQIKGIVKANLGIILKAKNVSKKDKVKALMVYLPPRLYLAIYNKFDGDMKVS